MNKQRIVDIDNAVTVDIAENGIGIFHILNGKLSIAVVAAGNGKGIVLVSLKYIVVIAAVDIACVAYDEDNGAGIIIGTGVDDNPVIGAFGNGDGAALAGIDDIIIGHPVAVGVTPVKLIAVRHRP